MAKWVCGDKVIEYGDRTLIMGIVNVTPDSFSDGGKYYDADTAVKHALELIEDGADIIDFGAQSTRPGYKEISPEEEWERLKPVLSEFAKMSSVPVSIDTYFPFVAEKALEYGADIINDVSGDLNSKMPELVNKSGAGYIAMHNGAGGTGKVKEFFEKAMQIFNKEQLCLDMGIGFGKTYEQNLELLANVKDYKIDGYPLLLGTSRKRVIGASSGETVPEKRIYGNIAADTAAILGGADIVRIHDVKNEIKGIKTADEIKRMARHG